MIGLLHTGSPKVVAFKFTGTLHHEDYEIFLPTLDDALETRGVSRILVQLEDFHGWDLQAAWDDLKFDIKHYADFERIAVVGDRQWEEWMAIFGKLFTKGEVKYFDAAEIEAAWSWVKEGIGQP